MFGTNQIQGKKFFENAKDTILVTSKFLTLQGEGPFQGQPAYFIRTTHCNLRCNFCDTHFDSGDWYTITELTHMVVQDIEKKYGNVKACGIVLTGGEPSLQQNAAQLLWNFEDMGAKFTQIETNGIIPLKKMPFGTTVVCSPKCSEHTGRYLEPHAATLNRASCLKFVVSADPASPYHKIPDWAFEWRRESRRPIYVSPMNVYKPAALQAARQRITEQKEHNIDYRSTVDEVVDGWDDTILDREQNKKNHQYASKYALDNLFYLTLQMQLYTTIA